MNSKVFLNYLYNLSYEILSLVLPIFSVPYVSRVLGAYQLGKYYYVTAVVAYFGIFAVLGTVDYGQREIAKRQDDILERSKTFWDVLVFRVFFIFVALIIYIPVIFFSLAKYRLLYIINIISFVCWACDVSWYFQGMENYKVTALKNGMVKIAATILIFVLIKSQNDVWLYTLIYALAGLVGNLTMFPYLKGSIVFLRPNLKHALGQFTSIFGLFLPVVAIQLYNSLDKIILGQFSTSRQVGYFSQVQIIVNFCVIFVAAYGGVMTPHISYLYQNGKRKIIKNYIQSAIKYVYMLAVPMVIGCLCIGDIFVPVFFGPKYKAAIPTLYILACLIVVMGMGQLQGQFLIAINRQKYFSFATVSALVINFIIAIVLIVCFHSGATGTAFATVISEIVATCIEAFYLKDISGLESYFSSFMHYLAFGALIIVPICIIRIVFNSHLLIIILSLIFGSICYGVALLISKDVIILSIIEPFINKFKRK